MHDTVRVGDLIYNYQICLGVFWGQLWLLFWFECGTELVTGVTVTEGAGLLGALSIVAAVVWVRCAWEG